MTTITERKLFTNYEALRVLGRGAMGTVYLARDLRDGSIVALKTISGESVSANPVESIDDVKRMEREAELSKQLDHPSIVGFHDAGYENGQIAFLAIEFVDGESLEELMKRENQVSFATVHQVTLDLLAALGHAHARGIVHRDLKPANVLMTRDRRAKLADFGIARPEESTLTVAGQRLGTPLYTAPENIMGGDVSPRSDLFSLGVVVYEMIAGQRPFAGTRMQEILMNVVTRNPIPLADLRRGVDPAWQAFVFKLLEKKPENRFQSADEALNALGSSVRPPAPTREMEMPPMAEPSPQAAVPVAPAQPSAAPSPASPQPAIPATAPAPPPRPSVPPRAPTTAAPPQKPSFWDFIRRLFGK